MQKPMLLSPAFMAIINLTPDSFSDGGTPVDLDAIAHRIKEAIAWGVTYIDIGAESTRPNASVVSIKEELKRLTPVFDMLPDLLKEAPDVKVSLDTRKASIAEAGLDSGAVHLINDVSGGHYDGADMFNLIVEAGCSYIMMHSRGTPKTMDSLCDYTAIVQDVCQELQQQIDMALSHGVTQKQLILDPGIGFAKTQQQSIDLLKGLPRLKEHLHNMPLLVGLSRKRVTLASVPESLTLEASRREAQTAILHHYIAQLGCVDIIRVHDAPQHIAAHTLSQMLDS